MTDRDPRRAAIIGLAITAALVLATVSYGGLGLFEDRYTVTARFADGADLQPGAPVRVAGVRVGTVEAVERVPEQGHVAVRFTVRADVRITAATNAAIRLRSLLGAKYLHLDDPGRGPLLRDGAVIALERTQVPVDLDELLGALGGLAEPLDTEAVNRVLAAFSSSIEGHGPQLGHLVEDIGTLAGTLAERSDDLDRLLVAADHLLGALDGRREALAGSIEDLATVFHALEERRHDLVALTTGIAGLRDELVPLLDDNREELAALFDDLGTVVGVMDRQRERLDVALTQLPLLAQRFTAITDDGPWVNVYFVGVIPGPFIMNPIQVGEDGSLPPVWVDDPGTEDQEVAGTRAEFENPEPEESPPDGYPG